MIHHRKLSIKGSPPAADINITPLIDIVLVLLIIFMVVTPLLEKDIGVRVPATEQVEQHDEVPPDQLVVRIDDKGDLSINNNKVPQSEYVDRLRGLLSKKGPNDKLGVHGGRRSGQLRPAGEHHRRRQAGRRRDHRARRSSRPPTPPLPARRLRLPAP